MALNDRSAAAVDIDVGAWWQIIIRVQITRPVPNPLAAVSKIGQFRLPHSASVHSAVNDYGIQAVELDMRMNSICAVIAAWLYASQRRK